MIVINNKSAKRWLKIILPFVLIPIVVIFGASYMDERAYLFISLAVAVLSLILFIAGFDRKQQGSRRLVLASIMIALSVIGRLIPFFKPITAICILSAMYLGSETGFLIGSFSALISNFYFGQGPWTPFQMLSFGIIGLFAGYLKHPLIKYKWLTLIFGVLSGLLYSLIMDLWNVLWYNGFFDINLYLASVITALPHTVLYAISNFIFLMVFYKPFKDKLSRIKIKYGI